MEAVVSALISGALALVGVILTSRNASSRMQSQLEKHQAVTDTKLEELTREVREHNNFALRMPVVEEQVKGIHHRLRALETVFKMQ